MCVSPEDIHACMHGYVRDSASCKMLLMWSSGSETEVHAQREREREEKGRQPSGSGGGGGGGELLLQLIPVCVCVCVCVWFDPRVCVCGSGEGGHTRVLGSVSAPCLGEPVKVPLFVFLAVCLSCGHALCVSQ